MDMGEPVSPLLEGFQGKLGIVRWEDNQWGINPKLKVC
jgi:hypothetical protein